MWRRIRAITRGTPPRCPLRCSDCNSSKKCRHEAETIPSLKSLLLVNHCQNHQKNQAPTKTNWPTRPGSTRAILSKNRLRLIRMKRKMMTLCLIFREVQRNLRHQEQTIHPGSVLWPQNILRRTQRRQIGNFWNERSQLQLWAASK